MPFGGSSQPAGYAVTSGPTVAAAQEAARAQVSAAQMASQAATENTQAAIQALMGEYSTALQYSNPAIFTGNQAEAQMNYMLGLPAVSPGPAPTAPVKPTLQSAEQNLTQSEVNNYILQNTISGQSNYANGKFADYYSAYVGGNGSPVGSAQPSSVINNTTGESVPGIATAVSSSGMPSLMSGLGNGAVQTAAETALAQQELQQNLLPQYQNQLTQYNQQMNAYNNEEDIYNRYNALGQATPETISNIVTNLPGYQFNMNQGVSAIQNAASASGLLNSGALLTQLNQFGQGLASNYYNTYMGQLGQLAGMGQQATQGAVQGALTTGNTTAGLQSELGTTQANAYLAAGQATANSYLSPAANQQSIASPYGSVNTSGATMGGLLGGLGSLFSGGGGGSGLFSFL